MKKNEKAFIALILIGIIMRLSLISFGQWIFLIGIGLLANSYFFGFTGILNNESYQDQSKKRDPSKKLEAYLLLPPYSIVIILIGCLFKFMAWPGGDLLILIALVLLLVGIYIVWKKKGIETSWKRGALQRMIIYGLVASMFYLLPNFFWFDIMNRDHPAYIEATKNYYENPEDEGLRIKLEEEYEKMKNGI